MLDAQPRDKAVQMAYTIPIMTNQGEGIVDLVDSSDDDDLNDISDRNQEIIEEVVGQINEQIEESKLSARLRSELATSFRSIQK